MSASKNLIVLLQTKKATSSAALRVSFRLLFKLYHVAHEIAGHDGKFYNGHAQSMDKIGPA